MDLDGNALLLSFVIGGAGFVCFSYGKRQGRLPQMIAGLALIVYPYFVPSVLGMLAIAMAIFGLLALAIRMGA